jgi:hypothetical protein
MKTRHSKNRSLKQNSNRLAAYLATGIGAGLVATPMAEAAIVNIDITSTGFGIDGVNGGVAAGAKRDISNFPLAGAGGLRLANSYDWPYTGLYGHSGLLIAYDANVACPRNFAQNTSIDANASFTGSWFRSNFKVGGSESPDFGSESYMGFKTAQGNYGWLEVTWSGDTDIFQIYSGAYESVADVAILAGDTGTSAVPEPGQVASSLLLLALGAAGVGIQRQRAKKKQQAEAVSLS